MASSSRKPTIKPIIFVADDDAVFLRLAKQLFIKFGATVETFSSVTAIQERLKLFRPAFCVIDLNLEQDGAGFELIKWVRLEISKALPLIVVSGNTDTASVAHAIELGANDYLLKPLNREVLISKLSGYLKSEEIERESLTLPTVPAAEMKVELKLDMQIQEIDELGIRVLSKHLITKGTVLSLMGTEVEAFSGSKKALQVTAGSTWVESATGSYGAYLEFDTSDPAIAGNIRNWIIAKSR